MDNKMSVLENGMDEILAQNERNVSDDLEWAGLASFKFVNNPRPCEGLADDLNWSVLDKYFSLLNFKPGAYQNAKKASVKEWEKQVESLSGQNSKELKEYYSRLFDLYIDVSNSTQNKRGNIQTKPVDDEFTEQIKENTTTPWVFSSLPGIDPASWPFSLSNLLEKLQTFPPLTLWLEPFDLNLELLEKIKIFISKHSKDQDTVCKALKVMLLFAYLSGNGTKLALAYSEVWKYCSVHEVPDSFIEELSTTVAPHVEMIKKIIDYESSLHYAKPGSLMGRFSAAHNSKFQKNQNGWNTSITSDGDYIYLLVSTVGGGKFKIGTGEGGTLTGKVYLYKTIDKAEESMWTYCKGKLYMKSSFRETGVVSIICPNTFKNEGLLQLYCPDLFGNPTKQMLNKYYPLLSDGESLFIVGAKLEKIPVKPEEKKVEEKVEAKKEENKDAPKEEVKKEEEAPVKNPEQPLAEEDKKIQEDNQADNVPLDENPKPQPAVLEANKIEENKVGDPEVVENPKPEENKVEEPKVVENPKLEENKVEDPKVVENLKVEDPKLVENKIEDPKLEDQKVEEKKVEEQKIEEKKVEEQKIEEKKVEEQKIEEQKVEEQKIEEQKVEENKIEEQKVEENKIEEQKVGENKLEEKKVEDNKIEEKKVDDNKIEEKKVDDNKIEELKADEPKLEEQKVEENKLDNQKVEDSKIEENKSDNQKVEENKIEDPKVDVKIPEELKAEENLKNEIKIEAKNENPEVEEKKKEEINSEPANIVDKQPEPNKKEEISQVPKKIQESNPLDPKPEEKGQPEKKPEEKKAENKKPAAKKLEKKEAAKKEEKKDDPNLCQFILYKFDMSHLHSDPRPEQKYSELTKELYEGFSCYFSMSECQRALAINSDDIELAATWLIENGENERGKRIVTCEQSTLLCEATITSYSMGKLQKPEISLKSDTILSIELVSRGEWTMNKNQITLHFLNPDGGSATARIFSIHPKDVKFLYTDSHVLPNTLNQVAESKNDSDYWMKYGKEKTFHTYRGSHICNKDSDKPFATESIACYDINYQKFYVTMLNGNYGIHFTVHADQVSLKDRISTKDYKLGNNLYEKFVGEGFQTIQECELHKFSLPWKWLRWTSVYSKAILRYTKLLKASTDDEKIKNIQKIIEKLQARLRKLKIIEETNVLASIGINHFSILKNKNKKDESVLYLLKEKNKTDGLKQSTEKPLVSLDNSKESIFSLESTETSLKTLLNILEIDEKILVPGLHLMFLWITHSRPVLHDQLCTSLNDFLIKGTQSDTMEVQQLSWKILNIGWESICNTKEKESFWFSKILKNCSFLPKMARKDSFIYKMRNSSKAMDYYTLYKDCTDPLLMWYLKHVFSSPLSIPERSYSSLLKDNLKVMIDKGSENDFSTASVVSFTSSDVLAPISKRNKLGYLLDDNWGTFEEILISSINDPSSDVTQALFEILIFLCKESYSENKNPAEKLSELVNSLLSKVSFTINDRVTTFYTRWFSLLRNLVIQCLCYTYTDDKNLTKSLISILSKVKKLFTIEGKNLLQYLCNSFSAGADMAQEKVIETSHPYQRGKQQINETITFPGAIAVCIELDPRSQTDNLHDCLWLSSPDNSGFNNFSGEVYGSSFKLSGKIVINHQLVLQGDQVHIEFNAAGQHREESNTSRWGFKIKIKPYYGEPMLFLTDNVNSSLLSKISLRLGGENTLIQWISTFNWLSFAVSQRLREDLVNVSKATYPILTWPIFEGGLSDINLNEFLIKTSNTWSFKKIEIPKSEDLSIETLKKKLMDVHQKQIELIFAQKHKIFDLVKDLRKLQGYPERYNSERLRPTFKLADKKHWEVIEAITLYTMIYHTHENKDFIDIINLNPIDTYKIDQGYIKDQLKVYAKKINELLNWMLKQVQTIKEKQHALEDVFEMKAKLLSEKKIPVEEKKSNKIVIPKLKTNVKRMSLSKSKSKKSEKNTHPVKKKPELDQKDKETVSKLFSERLAGNSELIKDLCKSFKVVYEEGSKCIVDLFEKIWDQSEDSFPNPYQKTANNVFSRLLVLLMYNPCLEDSNIIKIQSEEEISIPTLKRAHTEENCENLQKIAEMRKWVDSYKKWKEWKNPKQDLEEDSPLTAIFNFITEPEIPNDTLNQSLEHSINAGKRIVDLQSLGDFLNIVHLTPSVCLALGILTLPDPYAGIQSCGKQLKNYLNEQANKIITMLFTDLNFLIENIKTSRDSLRNQPFNIKKESKLLSSQFQYTEIYLNHQLRLIVSLLSDIYLLIKSGNYCENIIKGLNIEEIISTLVEIFLYCSSLHYSKLTISVSSGVKLILTAFLSASKLSSSFEFKEKMQQEIMSILLHYLSKEISTQHNSIRLEKLLALLFEIIISTGLHQLSVKVQLMKYLSSIILESSNPGIIRLAGKISKLLLKEISPSVLSNNLITNLFEKIGSYASFNFKSKSTEKTPKYVVLLHSTTSEEDIDYLFPVLSQWEELYPNTKYTLAKSEEDISMPEDPFSLEDAYENELIGGLPIEFDGMKRFAVYNRYYLPESGRGGRRRAGKKPKAPSKKPNPKKTGSSAASLTRLEKIFDENNKAFEDIKENDTEEEKDRKTKEKNFINKVKSIIKETQNVTGNLLNKGVAQIGDVMCLDQAIVLSILIKQHQTQLTVDTKHKLPVLPLNPYSKVPQEAQPTEVIKSKKPAQISISDAIIFQKIDYLMETGQSLPALRSSEKLSGIVTGNYIRTFLQKPMLTGACISLCIQELLDFLCSLVENDPWKQEIHSKLEEMIGSLSEDNPASLGALVAYGGWQDNIRPGSSILIESNNTKVKEIIIQGGDLTGLKNCLVLVEEDSNYVLKSYQLSELVLAKPRLINKINISHSLLAQTLVNLDTKSSLMSLAKRELLLIATQIDWNPWLASDPPISSQFIQSLVELSSGCPADKLQDYWESKLVQVWEKLADRDPPIFISSKEESKSLPSDGFLLSVEETGDNGLLGFTLPASSYLTFHPQLLISNSDSTNHKMLKYWEKYIIPRIQEYVRSSFKPIEMDYFFAQLRQPLRIGDVHKASEVANVLCDYRLPSGLALPDQKHDWSALVIDEVFIGKSCIVKITDKLLQQQENQTIRKMHAQGVVQFPVIIRAMDNRAACLLVEFYDHERLELNMVWLPISSIHPPEVHVPYINQIKDLSVLYMDYDTKLSALYAKKILLQSMSGIQKGLLDMIEIMKIACWEDLTHDRIEGWRYCRSDYYSLNPNYSQSSLQYYIHHPEESQYTTPKLNWIEEKILPGKEASLVEWCVISWHQLRDEMSDSARSLDIVEVTTALMGPQLPLPSTPENIVAESNLDRKYFPLHYQDSKFCGLVLCFRQEAFLCSNSKLQFFADPEGCELIYELKAGAQGKGNLSPIIFKTGKVWCTNYSFIDIKCSQYNTNFSGPSTLNCRVFGIPESWTLTTWMTEVLSSALSKNPSSDSISLMHSLEDSICEFLESSHSPTPIRQILFRLLIRIGRRLRYMNSKIPTSMGIKAEWLSNLINEMNVLRDSEFTGTGTLYSSYIQDGIELINTLLLPWDVGEFHKNNLEIETPDWIHNNYNTLVFLNYFRHEGLLTDTLQSEAIELLQHNQWETVILLEGIEESTYDNILQILGKHKVRILSAKNDIIFFDNKCVIFGDGLSTQYFQETNFAEEVKQPEKEEDNKEAELWNCDRCTFVNSIDCPVCGMCENPKPVIEVKPKIPHIDIRDIENKLISKKKTTIEELLQNLTTELKCTARTVTETDSDILNVALKNRMFDKEGNFVPIFNNAFEAVWMELKDILSDEMHKAKEKFLSSIKDSAYLFFKELESKGVDLWLQKTLGIVIKSLTRKQLETLTDYVENSICHQTRASLYLPPSHIRFPIENVTSVNHCMIFCPAGLSGITIEQVRYNWALIRVFNRYIFDSIGLCNLRQHSLLPRDSLTLSVASALSELRALVVFPVKMELEQHVFALTSVLRESAPKVILERLKVTESNQKKLVNFTKAFEQLKDVNPSLLRPPKPQGADPFISFEVIFKGELVVGEAGPYRQFFADISKEIQNPNSELLCPTPNNIAKSGEGTHKYTIRPNSNSLLMLQMYEFLGLLMGCCVRTGTRLTLDLPSFFWKPLVGMNLRFDDLTEIDSTAGEILKLMESALPELFEESFENFSTKLSDLSLVDLVDNGRNIPVTYENKKDFIKLVLNVRFQESIKQIKALREGLAKVVPIGLLNLITWKQLEEWVCGKPTVDLELLRRHTRYSGGLTESSPRIVWFWEVLLEFTQEELSKFVKFSWGQERLPSNDEEYLRTHTRLMIKPSMNPEHKDGSLPKADTCFFNLEIPDYSTKEILRNKLRYGFFTDCEFMNADNPLSEQQEAGMYREDNYSGEEE